MSATTTLIGNTTDDVQLWYAQNGKAVGNLTIVVQDRKLNRQTNEWEDGDKWFARCTLWGEFAEHAAGSLPKGTRVIAEGRISQREYETREGEKRTSVEVTIDEIGPSLRYATAQVVRADRSGGRGGANTAPQGDWSGQTGNAPQNDVWGQQAEDAPF